MQESYISELETKADRKARLMEDWKRQVGLRCSVPVGSIPLPPPWRFAPNSAAPPCTVACFAIEPFALGCVSAADGTGSTVALPASGESEGA